MPFERLLAKSRPKDLPKGKPEPESMKLHLHLADVHRAAAVTLPAAPSGDKCRKPHAPEAAGLLPRERVANFLVGAWHAFDTPQAPALRGLARRPPGELPTAKRGQGGGRDYLHAWLPEIHPRQPEVLQKGSSCPRFVMGAPRDQSDAREGTDQGGPNKWDACFTNPPTGRA
jgi:hypothetical protein